MKFAAIFEKFVSGSKIAMKIVVSICLFFVLIGCKKSLDKIPDCIQTRVNQFKLSTTCQHNVYVKEYRFQGKLVCVFDETACINDGTASVFDEDCNTLGMLGGIAGFSKINGIPFYQNAVYIRIIWSK